MSEYIKCKVCRGKMIKKQEENFQDQFGPNTDVIVYTCTGCNNKKLEYV